MISIIIISSLVIFGLHYSYQFDLVQNSDSTSETQIVPTNKEILWFVKYYAHKLLYKTKFEWLLKPLCDCTTCMASVYSSGIYWGYWYLSNYELNILTFAKWVVVILAVAGLNRLAYKFLIS